MKEILEVIEMESSDIDYLVALRKTLTLTNRIIDSLNAGENDTLGYFKQVCIHQAIMYSDEWNLNFFDRDHINDYGDEIKEVLYRLHLSAHTAKKHGSEKDTNEVVEEGKNNLRNIAIEIRKDIGETLAEEEEHA